MNFKVFFESEDWWADMIGAVRPTEYKKQVSADEIYSILTKRDGRKNLYSTYEKNLKGKESRYTDMVNNIESKLKSKGYIVSLDGYWVHIQMPYKVRWQAANYENVPMNAYKEYRSFVQSPDNLVMNFLSALEGFAEVLKNLQDSDPNYPDRMQYKFPEDLETLNEHVDSLVVHFRNPHNRPKVSKTIDDYFSSKGVKFGNRLLRGNRGYDMDRKSHTELISQALARMFAKISNLDKWSDKEIKKFIEIWMSKLNSYSPTQLQHALTGKTD